jgi:hypothetical protein
MSSGKSTKREVDRSVRRSTAPEGSGQLFTGSLKLFEAPEPEGARTDGMGW